MLKVFPMEFRDAAVRVACKSDSVRTNPIVVERLRARSVRLMRLAGLLVLVSCTSGGPDREPPGSGPSTPASTPASIPATQGDNDASTSTTTQPPASEQVDARQAWAAKMAADVAAVVPGLSDDERSCLEAAFAGLSADEVDQLVRGAVTNSTAEGDDVGERVLRSCGIDPARVQR